MGKGAAGHRVSRRGGERPANKEFACFTMVGEGGRRKYPTVCVFPSDNAFALEEQYVVHKTTPPTKKLYMYMENV